MKVATWVKAKGDTPRLVQLKAKRGGTAYDRLDRPFRKYECVWISCVFTWNRKLAEEYKSYFDWIRIPNKVGGTGVSLVTKLPDEIENCKPDYGLYPCMTHKKCHHDGDDRAIGFLQRGCIRACDWCVVNAKEGLLKDNPYRPLEEWVPDDRDKVVLLDNEFAAMSPDVYDKMPEDREKLTIDAARANGWRLCISQGYDLRCVNERKAGQLADWKPRDIKFHDVTLYVAWDLYALEPGIRRGLQILRDAGFGEGQILCYCLTGKNTTHLQDYARFHILWNEYKVRPYIMQYNNRRGDRFDYALARFANRGPSNYRHHDFHDWCIKHFPDVAEEAWEVVSHMETGEPVPLELGDLQLPMVSNY